MKTATKAEPLTEYSQLEGTAYVSVSYDGKFVEGEDGTVMAHVPVDLAEVSKVDLDDYGYGIYKKAAPEGADYKYETSVLQLAVYLHEQYAAGGAEGFGGYDSDPEGNWGVPHTFGISKFWGRDNPVISYNVNAEMGATTLDGLHPADGDLVEFNMFAGAYYGDANAGNLYFYESADAGYADYATAFEAEPGEAATINVRKVAASFDPDTWESSYAAVPVEGLEVSYGRTYGEAEGSARADAQGNVEIAFAEEGSYLVWADGVKGAGEGVDYAVTSPAIAKVIVGNTAADEEDVKQLARDIRNAERLLATVASSADGSDVADDELWAPDEDIEALEAAIADAKAVLNDPDATAAQVAEAMKALAAAKADFNEAIVEGEKASEATLTELEEAIAEAEATASDGATDAAKANLAKAIADAKALAEDPNASAADVADAIEAMETAAAVVEKQAADAAAAKKVADAIAALPAANKATADDAAKADAAKAAYDSLTADQKKLIDAATVTKLTNVKAATDKAKKAAAEEAKNGLAKGKTFTVKSKKGTFTYKVTAKKQVTLTKAAKTKAKAVVAVNKVKYKGVTYKVTAIGPNAFKASKFKKVTVGANVKTIGKRAFVNSKQLKTLIVGKNVKKIAPQAFKGCKKLTKLTVKSSKLVKKATVKNALKGSKVKTVKLSGVKKAAKTKTVKAFKAAGKKGVKVK